MLCLNVGICQCKCKVEPVAEFVEKIQNREAGYPIEATVVVGGPPCQVTTEYLTIKILMCVLRVVWLSATQG